ncbi:MAG: hypothetical protein KDH88_07555 [Chromatiales bacterium]|nr:hypothetical protein [Chromatiales bacterium]
MAIGYDDDLLSFDEEIDLSDEGNSRHSEGRRQNGRDARREIERLRESRFLARELADLDWYGDEPYRLEL